MTQYFAYLQNGTVREVVTIPDGDALASCFDATFVSNCVRCSNTVTQGMLYSNGVFSDPPPVTPTLAQQALALLSAGCQIVSTGTPALNGTYPVDAQTQAQITAEITSILLNDIFADGGSTIEWLDTANASHSFTLAQFKTFATAVAAFVSTCVKCTTGLATALPTQPSTIP